MFKQVSGLKPVEDKYLLERFITASRKACEEYTNTSIVQQTWDLILDKKDVGNVIELPRPPLLSVSAVYTTDDDGMETIVPASYYRVNLNSTPGRRC